MRCATLERGAKRGAKYRGAPRSAPYREKRGVAHFERGAKRGANIEVLHTKKGRRRAPRRALSSAPSEALRRLTALRVLRHLGPSTNSRRQPNDVRQDHRTVQEVLLCGRAMRPYHEHNPWPLRDHSESCCGVCNATEVMPARISRYSSDGNTPRRGDDPRQRD